MEEASLSTFPPDDANGIVISGDDDVVDVIVNDVVGTIYEQRLKTMNALLPLSSLAIVIAPVANDNNDNNRRVCGSIGGGGWWRRGRATEVEAGGGLLFY